MNARADISSLADRVRTFAAGGTVTNVHFVRSTAVFVLGEDALLLVDDDGAERRVAVHSGAILSSVSDGARVVTGGDDGKVMVADARGASSIIAADAKRRWIDHVAIAPGGAIAWSVGKEAFVQSEDKPARAIELPSTVGGLAFAPKGLRLAVARYNGASLWFPNTNAEPERLEWKGSHLTVTFSPDSQFLVTGMQEPALHVWRLADRQDLRMQGYAARVRWLEWSADGKWLATSGARQLVLWPFAGKNGPMGKQPKLLAPGESEDCKVEAVVCHPQHPIAAAGYSDGLVLLVRIEDGAEIAAKHKGAASVTALAWSADGRFLAYGTEDGEAGILSDLS